MSFIMSSQYVITARYAGCSPNASLHHGVIKRSEGLSVIASLHIGNIFMGEASHQVIYYIRDMDLFAISEVVYSGAQDKFAYFRSTMLIKLYMHSALNLDFGRRSNDFGVITLRDQLQTLHNALVIYHHCFQSPRGNS